jgi:hypothetical protein
MTIASAIHARCGWVAAFVAFVAIAIPGTARAQNAGEIVPYQPPAAPPAAYAAPPMMWPPPPPAPPVKRWYGYQIMLTDLASIVCLASSRDTQYFGAMGFLAVPAVIHGVHHNTSMAIASPLLRVGLPIAGMLIGVSSENCPHNTSSDDGDVCGLGGALLGLGIGLLTAMIVDYSQATSEEVPRFGAIPPTVRRRPSGVTLAGAGVAPTANGATLVLGGAF